MSLLRMLHSFVDDLVSSSAGEDRLIPDQYSYIPMPPPLSLPTLYPTYLPTRHVTFSYSEFVEPEYSAFSGKYTYSGALLLS